MLAFLLVAALVGCQREPPEPVVFSADRVEVVALYGGEAAEGPPLYRILYPPALLVYSDGLVVADAHRTLRLTTSELTGLVRDLRGDLAHLRRLLSSREAEKVLDGGVTQLGVRLADGTMHSVRVNQLGTVKDYPRKVLRADERLNDLFARTSDSGAPFTSERVRLVLSSPPEVTGTVAERTAVTWPAGLPEPPAGKSPLVRSVDLEGNAARAVAAALPDSAWRSARSTPPYRLPDGSLHNAVWRYLAHDEGIGRN